MARLFTTHQTQDGGEADLSVAQWQRVAAAARATYAGAPLADLIARQLPQGPAAPGPLRLRLAAADLDTVRALLAPLPEDIP